MSRDFFFLLFPFSFFSFSFFLMSWASVYEYDTMGGDSLEAELDGNGCAWRITNGHLTLSADILETYA